MYMFDSLIEHLQKMFVLWDSLASWKICGCWQKIEKPKKEKVVRLLKATEAHFGQHEDLLSTLNQSIKGTKLKCLKIINALIQLIQPMQSS